MADVTTCAAAVITALETVPDVGTYDGAVPKAVPETGGYPDPYVVLWGGGGDDSPELTADGKQSTDTLIWDFQTTAVGATPAICRAVDKAVRQRLVNLPVGTGLVRRDPDGFNQQAPILDTQVTPSRYMLPRQWRLITN